LEAVDKLVAQELTKLSLTEREKVLNDLHAIPEDVTREPPWDVQSQRLLELQQALDHRLPASSLVAYHKALQKDPIYVQDKPFRLMFLRTDDWDPDKAAERLAKHFQLKLDLFGEDLLCQDITQDDLDEGTIELLYSGFIQDLPLRDMAGRVVSIAIPTPHWTVLQKVSHTIGNGGQASPGHSHIQ
jgi:hypothetical protein